jgi:hypothetical protein
MLCSTPAGSKSTEVTALAGEAVTWSAMAWILFAAPRFTPRGVALTSRMETGTVTDTPDCAWMLPAVITSWARSGAARSIAASEERMRSVMNEVRFTAAAPRRCRIRGR